MSCSKKICTMQSDDGLNDESDDKDSKRKTRNLSEKKRRDLFNHLVTELSSMVSSNLNRKMDKSTVLKATISFLKNQNEVSVMSQTHEFLEDWKPKLLTNEEFTQLILEAVDGFLIILGNSGNILYISQSVTTLLGYIPNDILGLTIYDMGCPEEQDDLYNIFTSSTTEDESPISFSCHIRRLTCDLKQPIYEMVCFQGYFRMNTDITKSPPCSSHSADLDDSRLIFIGTGRLQVPHFINEMRLVDANCKTEFVSRHSLEWTFLYLDHRAPPIIGYLPFELLGTSGYDYYHIDDIDRIVICHDALMQRGDGTSCSYRFLTKGQQWIWLQTKFYITYNQWNSKPEFVVCTHRVVSYADAIKDASNNALLTDSSSTSDNSSSASWYSSSPSDNSTRHQQLCVSTSKTNTNNQHSSDISSYDSSIVNNNPESTAPSTKVPFNAQTQYLSVVPPNRPTDEVPIFSTISQMPTIDLQRKHAELQALIGQQQAELLRVSEQLSLARLEMQGVTGNMVSSTTSLLIPSAVNGSTNQLI